MATNHQERRPHILVTGTATTEKYVPPALRGSDYVPPPRNRQAHASKLLQELANARSEAEILGEERKAFGVDAGTGLYLEFESEPGFDLKFENLEFLRSGIELIAVRVEDDRNFATIYVPEGKLTRFETIVAAYLNENTRKGKPKNQPLVDSISAIRRAVLKQLWTDDTAEFPAENVQIWWEVWLRVGDDREHFIGLFRQHAAHIGIQVKAEEIRFPDRTVVLVRGTREQIALSMNMLSCIAELRKAKETADFFLGSAKAEQARRIQDLLARTQWPPQGSPVVCILDTGVNSGHPLILPALSNGDLHTYDPAWGTSDHNGHGTSMAGLAIYGDLVDAFAQVGPVTVSHVLESVKILPPIGANSPNLYGHVTVESIARAELVAPERHRVTCMAVTTTDFRDRGQPSTWSAAIDGLASGADDDRKRLLVIAAGNTDPALRHQYPDSNMTDGIHDPGQAWNALTVGAYTQKVELDAAQYPGWQVVAPRGDLGPASSTSMIWQRPWPIKPDIVMEGGNMAIDPAVGQADYVDSLQLLSTHYHFPHPPLEATGDTSAAAALAARFCIALHARYPSLWPETVRALAVHSAEWTTAMTQRFGNLNNKANVTRLLRFCGFGVPSLERAMWSANNSLTLIAQDSLQPFDKIDNDYKSRDLNLHTVPWPVDMLTALGELPVEMRVTLSYFIEPNPARRGWTRRYRYASHGLRFDVKTPTETLAQFRRRINQAARDEELGKTSSSDAARWSLGPNQRQLGSLHSDTWSGTAAELAQRGFVAVYPVIGWWRERHQLGRWGKQARYSLVVTIRTPAVDVDIYTPVENMIVVPIQV